MHTDSIHSAQNRRVKDIVRLKQSRHRRHQKRFVIEGYREIRRALSSGITIESVYFSPEFAEAEALGEISRLLQVKAVPFIRMAKDLFSKCSHRQHPDGLLGVAPCWETSLSSIKLSFPPLLLVVESVEKPGNLGALVRTADAAGVDAVIHTDAATEMFNPNVIRSSQGLVFSMPVVSARNETVLHWLREKKVSLYATCTASGVPPWNLDLAKPIAIVMGSEHQGLSACWREHADAHLTIPMKGSTDSLNVAAAAAVILYEAARQRGEGGR